MPIVGVNRDRLFEALGRKYSESRGRLQAQAGLSLQHTAAHQHCYPAVPATAADEEFDQLCFEYGIELDDVVSG